MIPVFPHEATPPGEAETLAAGCDAAAAPHILVIALGSAGDMYPYLRLALGLLARGHRVTLAGPAAHAAMAGQADVPFAPLGSGAEYDELLADPDLWHPRRGFAVVWRGLYGGADKLAAWFASLPANEPVAVLAHPLALPGSDMLRATRPGLRIVTAWLAPSNLRSVHDPLTIGPLPIPAWMPLAWRHWLWRRIDAALVDPVALPGLNALRQARGLAPVASFIEHLQSVADAHVTLFPSWFAPTPPDWPQPLREGAFQLYDPHPDAALAPELERFLRSGDAPVVFTPGSGNRQAARWFERALAATRRLGRRAIFLTPLRAQVPALLPPDVLWQPYVPLRALLPSVAAIVHHGGIGTTAEALRAGVPHLIIPLAFDQFDNGARVERLAAGRLLSGLRARPRRLAAVLGQMLRSEAIRAGCAAAARQVAADARLEVAAIVEQQLGLNDRPAIPLSA